MSDLNWVPIVVLVAGYLLFECGVGWFLFRKSPTIGFLKEMEFILIGVLYLLFSPRFYSLGLVIGVIVLAVLLHNLLAR